MTSPKSKKPIGIFDSGVGGLTVANAVHQLLPNEHIIYFGDTAHLPYGDKSPDSIRHFALTISQRLLEMDCKAIVVACNSAATTAYQVLSEYLHDKVPFIEVVRPLVDQATRLQPGKAGIIATKATIESGEYQKHLELALPRTQLVPKATPLLVPMIEEGFVDDDVSAAILEEYLHSDEFEGLDVLLLACTHYPLIREAIARYLPDTTILDSTQVTAEALRQTLTEQGLIRSEKSSTDNQFFVSDYTRNFEQNAQLFFGSNVNLKEWDIWETSENNPPG